ncbi:MAG: glycoside hydrolase family 31 protein [Clostridia bacterium]|nr:glycoside hydrolase family 31 protein [Clostridia bacterium]
MKIIECNNKFVSLSVLSEKSVRIRVKNNRDFSETTGPVRYDVFNVSELDDADFIQSGESWIYESESMSFLFDTLQFSATLDNKENSERVILRNIYKSEKKGFSVNLSADSDEKYYGLGDTTRECLQKRGTIADIWVRNVKSYVPVPFLISSKNYGVYSNTTYRQIFDVCKNDNDNVRIWSEKGELDLVFFVGNSYSNVLMAYGDFAGKPSLLPQFAYGLTFVCNMENSARDMVEDMLNFRREEIPCDVIGLEPKWMSVYYDNTINKKFDETRFDMPSWCLNKEGLEQTFFGAIDRLGFKLSLWLCCDYDLSYEEERNAIIKKDQIKSKLTDDHMPSMDDFEQDMNIGHDPILMDKTIIKDQAWFEHLKKFTDYGAKAFKMDGAWQVNEHPDRLYGNGMNDDEMHNLYPLLLNKQMSKGYEDHTGTRSMIYSSGGFAGIQKYAATWAGDTGGGPKPLASMLNHAFSGHTNTSCDMHVFTKEGIHFGFFQTWSQLCSWAYWRQPWLLQKPLKQIYKDYAKLRYSLIPYIYSSAYQAYLYGTPVMRPLPFIYPQDTKVDDIKTQYMFGDSFLVSCFSEDIYLPEGKWIDYYSKKQFTGPFEGKLEIPENKGGGLFVKAGAIIPYWPDMDFVGEKIIDTIKLEIYPAQSSEFTLYEDDGISLEYKENKRCESLITCQQDHDINLHISKRTGSHDKMVEKRWYEVHVYSEKDRKVFVDNLLAASSYENSFIIFTVDSTSKDSRIMITD